MPDTDAARLAAIRAACDEGCLFVRWDNDLQNAGDDVNTLLAALAAAEQERDQARAERERAFGLWERVSAECLEWRDTADRLAALAQAARAWAKTDWDTDAGQEAVEVLQDAVAALAPTDGAPGA